MKAAISVIQDMYVRSYEAALNIIEAYAEKVDPKEIVDVASHGLLGHLEWLENWEPSQ